MQITHKNIRLFLVPRPPLSHEHSSTTFWVILLTDSQTNQQTAIKTYTLCRNNEHMYYCIIILTEQENFSWQQQRKDCCQGKIASCLQTYVIRYFSACFVLLMSMISMWLNVSVLICRWYGLQVLLECDWKFHRHCIDTVQSQGSCVFGLEITVLLQIFSSLLHK